MPRFAATGHGLDLDRRRFLRVTGTGALALASAAVLRPGRAEAVIGRVRWVSPRGTIEVLVASAR